MPTRRSNALARGVVSALVVVFSAASLVSGWVVFYGGEKPPDHGVELSARSNPREPVLNVPAQSFGQAEPTTTTGAPQPTVITLPPLPSTTTQPPRPTTTFAIPTPDVSAVATDVWIALAECESNNTNAPDGIGDNPTGFFQFIDSTWESTTGLPGPAMAYPYEQQLDAAQKLWSEGEPGSRDEPWPHCGDAVGLPD